MFPFVGQIVLVKGAPVNFNGTDEVPAIVTRVWTQHCVNVTAFQDVSGLPLRFTSVLFSEEDQPPNVTWDFVKER